MQAGRPLHDLVFGGPVTGEGRFPFAKTIHHRNAARGQWRWALQGYLARMFFVCLGHLAGTHRQLISMTAGAIQYHALASGSRDERRGAFP